MVRQHWIWYQSFDSYFHTHGNMKIGLFEILEKLYDKAYELKLPSQFGCFQCQAFYSILERIGIWSRLIVNSDVVANGYGCISSSIW